MKKNLHATLLEKLQSTYEHFPKREPTQLEESEFDSGLREFLGAYGQDMILAPGETLFHEGDVADGLYWISSGVVAILQGDMEKPRLLTFRTNEHVVGETAFLENIKRTATVAAITETKMKYLSQDKFSLIPFSCGESSEGNPIK